MRRIHLIGGAAALLIGSATLVYAQLEGTDRGIPPIDSTSNFEVGGILVDVAGENANAARQEGWKVAQRLGWKKLWSRTVGRPEDQAPDLTDAVLNQIVSGIVVEEEQIGPTRYIARLGLLFDRSRTGEMLGVSGVVRRSAPMLVIPVMRTGSTGYALEFRSPWQYAWAQFRTSTSPIDYVRPVGNGVDPLLLNAAQVGRRSRGWWRTLLDQYGASDVVMPEVQLKRAFPGGPAIGRFIARYGPDAEVIGTFELRAESQDQIPRMLAEGVQRMDALYVQAFNAGLLRPDPTLIPPPPQFVPPPPPLPGVEPVRRQAAPVPTQDEGITEEPAPLEPVPSANTQRPAVLPPEPAGATR
ncbi:MAG TPA: heavy-metal-associated domain-containing protein [Allosphingosinicella sp.]